MNEINLCVKVAYEVNVIIPIAATTLKTIANYYLYKKRLLLRCIHHFKSDLINNMDHMRISGTEPSSVILSKKKYFQKLKRDVQNVPKQVEAKRDHNYTNGTKKL